MLLKLDHISAHYGDLQALFNVSFEVQEKEIVSIVGPNGAGKSTTLKNISGVFHPSSGTIHFRGKEIQKSPPHLIVEMGLVQIPEGRRLFPRMSVLENLELGAYVYEGRRRKDETMKTVFGLFPILENRKNQFAGTLSGGEQQMLAIARGLMAKPKLLMLDEPSLGLAPLVLKQVFKVIEQINKEGIAILLVEQNVFHSLSIAKRGYVLENGRVVMEGAGGDLLNNKLIRKSYLGI